MSLITSANKVIKAVARGRTGDHYDIAAAQEHNRAKIKKGTKQIGITRCGYDEVSWKRAEQVQLSVFEVHFPRGTHGEMKQTKRGD